jgi:hypothetical protein
LLAKEEIVGGGGYGGGRQRCHPDTREELVLEFDLLDAEDELMEDELPVEDANGQGLKEIG